MRDAGSALMGIGVGQGDNRASEAARTAVSSPLLESSIEGATGILLNITGPTDLGLFEVNEAAEVVTSAADQNANVIFGAVIDENVGDEVRVTVIATGFGTQRRRRAPATAFEGVVAARRRGAPSSRSARTRSTFRRSCAKTESRQVAAGRRSARPAGRGYDRPRCRRFAERRSTRGMSPRARAWCRSPAGRCPSSTRASSPSTARSGPTPGSSTSRTWARSRSKGRRPATSCSRRSRTTSTGSRSASAQYTLLTTETGGIVDDLIVYRLDGHRYLLIVNASNREADFRWLQERELRGSDVRDVSDDFALLAVQGPRALDRLGLEHGRAFTWSMATLDGVEVMVNRTGYTGEEGVELACMADDAERLWDAVVGRGVTPCGLGARDTLRLEVCYPLHGNDIGLQWDAISSGLGWACALETEFTGVERLREVKASGPERKLVAFRMTEKAIPRQGMAIEGGGEVTSGSLSPMLDVGIGLGYVPAAAGEDRNRAGDRRARARPARRGRQETVLQARGVLSQWPLRASRTPKNCCTTPSTTGRGSTATRPCSE